MGNFDVPFSMDFVLRDLCAPRFKKETPNRKGEVEIFCPLRENKTFEVNVRREQWNCFKKCADCPCSGAGGVLDLYVLFYGGDRKTAYKAIMEAVNGNAVVVEKRKAESLPPIQETQRVSDDILDNTYNMLLDALPLTSEHKDNLIKRGLSVEDIERMKFRSIPQNGIEAIPLLLAKKGAILQGVPGFYFKNGKPMMISHGSGFYIPYRSKEGKIIGLQIRYDIEFKPDMTEDVVKKLKKMRYRWFTSSSEDGGTSAANVPFWGMPGTKFPDVVYATEGGLKAATAQSISGGCFVAIPGVTCYNAWEELLVELKKQGVKTLVDAFDSDRAVNPNVNDAIQKLHSIAESYGMSMKTWDWGTEYKGVDDYLYARKRSRERH